MPQGVEVNPWERQSVGCSPDFAGHEVKAYRPRSVRDPREDEGIGVEANPPVNGKLSPTVAPRLQPLHDLVGQVNLSAAPCLGRLDPNVPARRVGAGFNGQCWTP